MVKLKYNPLLLITDRKRKMTELLSDIDYGSFKSEYEKNNERQISFTAYKTNKNADIFEMLKIESIVTWKDQEYVIKSTSVKNNNNFTTNEVVAKHIFMDFQKHFIDKDLDNEELNSSSSGEESAPTYTIKQYLEFGFKNNGLGFTYEIIGNIDRSAPIETLGDKNGIEYLTEGAELFGYIYFADNKKIYIYSPDKFYKHSQKLILYKKDNDDIQLTTTGTDYHTIIRGYGKKKSTKETKNYNPIKTPALNYNGTFIKKGTWRTEKVGAYYEVDIDCKWGNETLEFNLKKGENGGLWDIYLDNQLVQTFSCWYRTITTEKIVIAKNLAKGTHKFKAVFKGPDPNINYKKNIPAGYVGTEKQIVFNITAVLSGKDLYHYYAEYKTPYYDILGYSKAPTVYSNDVRSQKELEYLLKDTIKETPEIEVSTSYFDFEEVKPTDIFHFRHEPLQLEDDLKVVKITEYHPFTNKPSEVEFSNSQKDLISINQVVNKRLRDMNAAIKSGKLGTGSNSSITGTIGSRSVGSV